MLVDPMHNGWDPLVPTDAGVYDGLQEALRYVYPMGENIRSSTCYAVMGGHMVCGEARRMVWNLRPAVTSSETIFLFGHILCILLGASCIFIFSLFAFLFCNKLGWTPAFFYGRETRSSFSLEYSCASLIFVEYSCLDIFSASSSCFACISCSELLAFGS